MFSRKLAKGVILILTTGQRLRLLRKQHGYTQEELAEIIHCHPTTINRFEEDKRIPRSDFLYELSKLYGVSMEFILSGK